MGGGRFAFVLVYLEPEDGSFDCIKQIICQLRYPKLANDVLVAIRRKWRDVRRKRRGRLPSGGMCGAWLVRADRLKCCGRG